MSKTEFFQVLRYQGVFSWHSILDGFEKIGSIWEVFPDYENKEAYENCFVLERVESGSVTRLLMNDEGRGWMRFVCEATVHVMDSNLEEIAQRVS